MKQTGLRAGLNRRARIVAAATALLLGAAACGTGSSSGEGEDPGASGGGGGSDEVVKAAWVYVGPKNDGGWTTAHDNGRLAVEEEFGDQVETDYVESVPEEPAAAARAIEGFARKGYDIIFTTSFGFMDPTLEVAKKYPDVLFEHCSGFKAAENMANYFGAMEEAKYLAGMAAGAATENGQLGKVNAFPIPEVIRLTNAFMLGARAVNPDATMKVVFTNSWFDPPKEKSAAESLLDAGADVLTQDVDSPATGQVAGAAGADWVGYNSDASKFAPQAWLTAPVWDWSGYYIDRVGAVIDGTWESGSYYGDLSDGIVDLAPYGEAVDSKTKGLISSMRKEIESDQFEVFQGPVRDQNGEVVVPEGETPPLEDLLSMDYYVEGIESKLPSS
ncbi:MAG: BMP family ABC transporter substrate-binding protein [Actinomycetota bacterium]|nr:BMP family ABC transporter substrate-binding protein [Actinomycetota bacterium]